MHQQLWPDHQGVWKIEVPREMPLAQVAMLQETIREAWADYDGDHNDTEAFWNHLTMGDLAAPHGEIEDRLQEAKAQVAESDVPRETSRYQVDAIYRVNGGALRTAQRTVDAYDWNSATDQVRHIIESALPRDNVEFGRFSGGIIPDGGPVVTDVPRETSQEGTA